MYCPSRSHFTLEGQPSNLGNYLLDSPNTIGQYGSDCRSAQVVIFVYGDDSSDEKKERVSAIGIIIGSKESWDLFEPKWVARNKGIPFHARDCESDQGDFKKFDHKENKTLYRDLVTMLAESDLGGLGTAIDIAAQQKIIPNSLDFTYYRAFVEMLTKISRFAARYGEIAKFSFDISSENEYNAGQIYSYFRENEPEMFQHFHPEISFAPAREYPRIQVADLMAFEAMKALDHTVGPIKRIRKSWEVLRETKRFETMSYSKDWFTDFKRDYERLGQELNVKAEDYSQWLQEKRRFDNVSNRLHFMNCMAKRGKK